MTGTEIMNLKEYLEDRIKSVDETYKKRRYVLAHRTCYNNYLKYVKETHRR